MKSDWQEVKLREVVSILGDGLHGTPSYDDNGDYHFINGNNLKDGRIIFTDKTRKVTASEYEKYKKNRNCSPPPSRDFFIFFEKTLDRVSSVRNVASLIRPQCLP